jgi:hypothetical protein
MRNAQRLGTLCRRDHTRMLSWNRTSDGSYGKKMWPVISLNCSSRIGPQDGGSLDDIAGGPPSDVARTPAIINENGQRNSITKLQAVVKQLVNKAASGEP